MISIPIDEWSPDWSTAYNLEALRIAGHLARWAALSGLHHIGATAVPGLSARPIVDILFETDGAVPANHLELTLLRAGYEIDPSLCIVPDIPIRAPAFPTEGETGFHMHVVPHGSSYARDLLCFRDELKARPASRRRLFRSASRVGGDSARLQRLHPGQGGFRAPRHRLAGRFTSGRWPSGVLPYRGRLPPRPIAQMVAFD